MVFDFGNPTRNSGRFFENCAGRFKHRYRVRRIDSRDVAITNKRRITQWVDDYGAESDFFKVRVRGEFPSVGDRQFINTDDVNAAMRRVLVEDKNAPLVIGVDVARFGENESVLFPRRGRDARSFPPRRFRGLDTVQLTGRVIEMVREFRQLGMKVAAIFVDGGGIGGAVVDQLRHLGYNPIEVQFGGRPMDPKVYRYKMDELWGRLSDGLKNGLCLPEITDKGADELERELTQREYDYTPKGQLILESKDSMQERGIESPDIADALVLTYTQEVAPLQTVPGGMNSPQQSQPDYDPLATKW